MKENYVSEADVEEQVFSGWVSTIRDLGNIKFIILRDSKGLTQVILKKGVVENHLLSWEDAL